MCVGGCVGGWVLRESVRGCARTPTRPHPHVRAQAHRHTHNNTAIRERAHIHAHALHAHLHTHPHHTHARRVCSVVSTLVGWVWCVDVWCTAMKAELGGIEGLEIIARDDDVWLLVFHGLRRCQCTNSRGEGELGCQKWG